MNYFYFLFSQIFFFFFFKKSILVFIFISRSSRDGTSSQSNKLILRRLLSDFPTRNQSNYFTLNFLNRRKHNWKSTTAIISVDAFLRKKSELLIRRRKLLWNFHLLSLQPVLLFSLGEKQTIFPNWVLRIKVLCDQTSSPASRFWSIDWKSVPFQQWTKNESDRWGLLFGKNLYNCRTCN